MVYILKINRSGDTYDGLSLMGLGKFRTRKDAIRLEDVLVVSPGEVGAHSVARVWKSLRRC